MRRRRALLALLSLAPAWPGAGGAAARAGSGAFRFGVIGHAFQHGPDDAVLARAIAATNRAGLAFVVATGVKAGEESCGDKLYNRRRDLLNASGPPMIVALAASDWSDCRNSQGKSAAIERLGRLRDVFFADSMSLGNRKIALTRLSSSASFRGYAENALWEHGHVLFATINLPANNNHFLPEAGRNSEFEDRLVANRAWLKRLFAMAQQHKLDGLALFSDGDVGALEPHRLAPGLRQDGFAEVRRQIAALARGYAGKVLLVDTQGQDGKDGAAIAWRDNIGHLSLRAPWVEIAVDPGGPALFAVRAAAPGAAP